MYVEDNNNSHTASDCEEISVDENISNITKKSVSTVGFRNHESHVKPLAIRATQSLTGTVEEMRLCDNFQRINLCNRMNVVTPTAKLTAVCPCGCLLKPAVQGPFRTREKNTLALHVVSPEVLSYQGYRFEPSQIAMFWKKDCRAFLWKGKAKLKNNFNVDSHKKLMSGKYRNNYPKQ